MGLRVGAGVVSKLVKVGDKVGAPDGAIVGEVVGKGEGAPALITFCTLTAIDDVPSTDEMVVAKTFMIVEA